MIKEIHKEVQPCRPRPCCDPVPAFPHYPGSDAALNGHFPETGLEELILLGGDRAPAGNPDRLTAKKFFLPDELRARAGEICAKDDLIRAVWPEDKVFERGVGDGGLAPLARRPREKAGADATRRSGI